MNDNEIFTQQELEEMSEKMKKNEKTELPESLSKENIKKALADIPQNEAPSEQKSEKEKNNTLAKKMLAVAASFAIVVSGLAIAKPWKKSPSKIISEINKKTEVQADDYSDIERLFCEYSDNYKKMRNSPTLNFFGMKSFDTADEAINGVAEGTTNPPRALGETVTEASKTAASGSKDSYGKTNEQVKGVSEADIIKNDGKYLYAVMPDNADWEKWYEQREKYYSGIYAETTAAEAENEPAPVEETPAVTPVEEEELETTSGVQSENAAAPSDLHELVYGENAAETVFETDSEQTETTAEETTETTPETTPETVPETSTETTVKDETEKAEKKDIPKMDYRCAIAIIEQKDDGTLSLAGKAEIAPPEDSDIYYMGISEIYVSENRLIAVVVPKRLEDDGVYNMGKCICCDCYYGSFSAMSMTVCFDISDVSSPKEMWRFYQDGSYISSRLIGDEYVLISNYTVSLGYDENTVKENCVPKIGTDPNALSRVHSGDITISDPVKDSAYLVVTALDTDDVDTMKTKAVLGAGQNVYCTTTDLYVTSTDYSANESELRDVFGIKNDADISKTQIMRFSIENYTPTYITSGKVDGHMLNQFSMDEYDGHLRVATTSGYWGENCTNRVVVLDKELNVISSLEDIAKGEVIKSARFTGNICYLVTFMQTDPLFVIDLSDPASPVLKGELKLPGFSSYLHPVNDELLIGIGEDGTEEGTNGGMKISLFDVSDPSNPKETAKYTMNAETADNYWSYIESRAYYDHKAVCFDPETLTLYVPFSNYKERYAYVNNDYSASLEAGAIAVKIDPVNKTIGESGEYISVKAEKPPYLYPARVTYTGNRLYVFTDTEPTFVSFDIASREKLSEYIIK